MYHISNMRIAGKNDRVVHWLVDAFFLGFILVITEELIELISPGTAWILNGIILLGFMGWGPHGLFLLFLYYVLAESIWGRTLGKMATGSYVLDKDGNKPKLRQIIGRSFLRLLLFDPYSYLFGKEVGMHDLVSNTLVVKKGGEKESSERSEDEPPFHSFGDYTRWIG